MVKSILKDVGSLANKVAGGFINRTLARLTGAGITGDSRLTRAKAKWSGRDSRKDWRVKLTIPEKSTLENYFFNGNEILAPLYANKGIFWPLTPSMVIQHSASYNALAQTHNNYPFQAYQNSQVDQINIIGEFPVQNQQDARHWVATIKFLRTITKMFFGQEDNFKGNPPPILHLSGYGQHMFEKVPVIVNTFNVELRSGIDYISTTQDSVYSATIPPSERLKLDADNNIDPTWAPSLSNVSVLVTPVYSRDTIKRFSLQKFANGELDKQEGIGFI
tara:strand:+ start:466 stop:1293 length:828 start_codon:yes stop_codon:yes gene_type:complete